MLVALFGVTGVGKSFYKNAICNRLKFNKLTTIRTREPREGEINGVTGLFMTPAELDELDNKGEIFYRFGVFETDFDTFKCRPKKSALWYRDFIKKAKEK